MKAILEDEIDYPVVQMIRNFLMNDDRLDLGSYDNQLIWLSQLFKKKFNKYLNEERTNHSQAKELALNDIHKKILEKLMLA